jgi:hypothetical protein
LKKTRKLSRLTDASLQRLTASAGLCPDAFQYWSLLIKGVEDTSKNQQRFYKYEQYWAVFAGFRQLASPHPPGVSGSKMQQV